MKKPAALLITMLCLFGLVGCKPKPSDFVGYQIHCTVPAGSDDVIFIGEKFYSYDGNVKITAHYETGDSSTLIVWLKDTTIQSAADGNPYTNIDILPGATVELKLDRDKHYEIGVSLVPDAASDTPVKITIHTGG